ncbi:hypothetical protein PHYPO_G00163540 [Pangasianodon hypophthalmus]|uniref:Rho-GAP domain-containing protein n=1 Tax=Pangasianodon hypophthalmus TaxID=310915 RepID=A0A5N5K6H9_PANHP|nr:hypothetical protein PHYPO_G00163540 [Pangasianodon hypophthalmus]
MEMGQKGDGKQIKKKDWETCSSDRKMMKMTVHRKPSVIKVFSKTRTLHSDVYWEDHASQNALLLLEDHAHLTIGSETRERLLLLSTDSLIVAKTKSLYLKLKARVSLSDIWLASCIQRVTSRKFSTKTSFVIGWPTTNYVVTLSSSETKDKWLCALQWHSVRARQRLIPNHIILNVQLFDSVLTTAVSVDVHSTSESVVQSVIQQNGLTGGVSDYQLCVLYDGKEEMYPLIGHELPYCILLHSLRGQRSQHMLGRHQWHSADELRDTDDVNDSTAPRFILKNRAAIHTHIHAGSLKHKRKKSLIGWALRKGTVQSEAQTDLQPTSNKLFGQSLASVCHDGKLPKPIMDLLCMLYREGPETLGIFRRSANAKSCRILKEKLNFGHRVSLRGESVFVAASLLTEFLRKLPGSVLGCELYEDWMNVMEADDQQSRCSSVKRVLAKLPQVNRTLLCYVFGVLHHIHTHSDVNQMTASNLALCIAPNMLWRATTSNPEQESQSTLEEVKHLYTGSKHDLILSLSACCDSDDLFHMYAHVFVSAIFPSPASRWLHFVRFLIESAPSIFGDEAEEVFSMRLNTAQENDDLTAEASLSLHSSSEETDLDFLPSPLLSPDLEPFLPLSTLSLSGNRKLRPFKVATETTDGAYSCGTLDLASTQPISLGEFGQSRDRCLSEPSMCFDATSPPQAPPHPPVIRQSSCDNAVMENKIDQSQSPVLQGRSRGAGKGRYAFWKSPQFPARFRHPAQRLASVSSLSSTATSSLSSLDSFEYIPSPSDDKPRPFLFGTSARLRPLTPEMPRKLWKMAFTYDEVKDGNGNGERNEEKEGGVKFLDVNFEDECKAKDGRKGEEDGEMKEDRSGVMEERDGGMRAEEHETPRRDEGVSCHMLLDNEIRDLGIAHTLTHTHACPVHTRHTRALHTHSLTLPTRRVKTSRMKITLFPSVGRRMFKQSGRVTMETGRGGYHGAGESTTSAVLQPGRQPRASVGRKAAQD